MTSRDMTWKTGDAGDRRVRSKPLTRVLWGLKIATVSLGLAAGALGAYCGAIIYTGNVHAVTEGVFYRSAQLGKANLEAVARQHGIKSVLNLRGAHPGEAWYDDEIDASRTLGLAHYDYALSAKRFVSGPQITQLLDIVRNAPKPLLVHCKSGADRAGLVSALYRYAIAGVSAAEADRQLSLAYGHFPYLTSRSGAMDDSFWAYVDASGRRQEK